jgi:carbon starvation protein
VGKTGGAVTLAVGMAGIFARVTHGRWLDLWYHFAIMFEALFILTTIDAGTRVGRYLLQDALGHFWKPLRQTGHFGANLLASCAMVLGWGFFLIMGVRDPEGGVKALWPIFGISNQMLAGIALCLATTVILKMQLQETARPGAQRTGRPWLALLAFVPLIWLLSVTMTAGAQKLFHPKPAVGFLASNRALTQQRPGLETALAGAEAAGDSALIAKASKDLRLNHVKRFNNVVDALATGFFMLLVAGIVVLSVREWILLLSRRKPAVLHETEPVWLPDHAVAEGGHHFGGIAGTATLALVLAKELSGEAAIERAARHSEDGACVSPVAGRQPLSRADAYVRATEERFKGIRRCC